MSGVYVVVERDSGRVGTILEELGHLRFKVEWPDSSREEVKLNSAFARVAAGSARYLQYVEADKLSNLFDSSPHEVFLMALREETPPAKSAKRLIELVAGYGFEPDAVVSAWKKSRSKFEAHLDVAKGNQKSPTYHWTGSIVPYVEAPSSSQEHQRQVARVEEPPAPETERAGDTPDTHLPGKAAAGDAAPPATDTRSTDAKQARRILKKLAESDLDEAERETLTASWSSPSKLDAILFDALRNKRIDRSRLEGLAREPLKTGTALAGYPHEVVDGVLNAVPENSLSQWYPVVAARPTPVRSMREASFEKWCSTKPAALALERALREYRETPAQQAENTAAIAALAERLSTPTNPSVGVNLWAAVLHVLSAPSAAVHAKARDGVLRRVIDQLGSRSEKTKDSSDTATLSKLAAATRLLPLEADGGRASLIAAIARIAPDELAKREWWDGLDIDTLGRVGDGRLGVALDLPSVRERIVKPLLLNTMRSLSTRRSLGSVLGTASVAASVLEPQDVAAAFRRVSTTDSILRSWMVEVSNEAAIESLRADLIAERAKRVAAESTAARALAERHEYESANARLREQLREANESQSTARSQEIRQAQIDIARAMAQLAATVEGEVGKLDAASLVSRVQQLLKRHKLSTIGVAGETLAFDPEVHEAPGDRPSDGQPVNVARSGYVWHTRGENVVLLKALVVRVEGD